VNIDRKNAVKLAKGKQLFVGSSAQHFFDHYERQLTDSAAVVRPESWVKSSLVPGGVEWSVFGIAAIQARRQECLRSALCRLSPFDIRSDRLCHSSLSAEVTLNAHERLWSHPVKQRP